MTTQLAESKPRLGVSICLLLVLVLAGVLGYANSLRGPFIFDDLHSIVENITIRDFWPPRWLWIAPQNATNQGRPVVSFTFAVNYAISGSNPLSYHIVNISIHILAALTLFGIIRRTLIGGLLYDRFGRDATGLAFACALFWLIHPMQTECVNYISQRSESLMGLFYLTTLYCAIRAMHLHRTSWWTVTSIVSCAIGMGCKQVMVTAPCIVLLYDRIFSQQPIYRVMIKRHRLYIGLASTWIILILLMSFFPDTNIGQGIGSFDYLLNQCLVLTDYFRLVLCPHPLALDYGLLQPIAFAVASPYGIFIVALLIASTAALIYQPPIGFLGAWVFVILAPTSSFLPIGGEVGAERRMYLPLAGFVVLFVLGVYLLLQKTTWPTATNGAPTHSGGLNRYKKRIGVLAILIVTTILWGTTIRRNHDYRSTLSIWESAVAARPGNPRCHGNLGNVLQALGQIDRAQVHYETALRKDPSNPKVLNNLASLLESQGHLNKAIIRYKQAVKLWPQWAVAQNNLGAALASRGQLNTAIHHFQLALKADSNHAKAHNDLGAAFRLQGRAEEAVYHYRRALEFQPDFAEAHNNLGDALVSHRQFQEAVVHYEQALEIDPYLVEAHNNLGIVHALQGQLDEAIGYYQKALKIQPDYAKALNNLGRTLVVYGKVDEAIVHLQKAVDLDPHFTQAHQNLGVALIRAERHDEAIIHLHQAQQLQVEKHRANTD